MPFKLTPKEIKAEKLIVSIEIELNKCSLDADELANRLAYNFNNSNDRRISEFIVMLLQVSRAATWELNKLEVNDAIRKETNRQIQAD